MAQFYTLDEAAGRLNMPVEDLKRRLKTDSTFAAIHPFRDGATLRFRAADIDELARSLGAASEPGLELGPVGSELAESDDDLIFSLPTEPVKTRPPSGRIPRDEPLVIVEDDDESDIFDTTGRSESKGDSDVRLDLSPPPRPYDPNSDNMTEEISLDLEGPGSATIKPSGLSGKLTTGKSSGRLAGGKGSGNSSAKLSKPASNKIPGPTSAKSRPPVDDDSSSEFELSLDPDSDSVELQLTGDSSEEVDLGGLDFGSKNKAGQSGINLTKPSDSGVSLEKKGAKTGPLGRQRPIADVEESDEFELSLDTSSGPSSAKLSGPKTGPISPVGRSAADSDSEFELTLDDNSGVADAVLSDEAGDADAIFDTDFELPAMGDDDSDSVSAVDIDSDEFEVALDDESAGDEVELIEDEGDDVLVVDDDELVVAPSGRSARRPLADEDDFDEVDEGPSASKALSEVGGRRAARDDYDAEPVVAAPAAWGPLPAIVLLLTLPLMFLGSLMSYEVVKGMFGYQNSSSPGTALVRGVATSVLGEKLAD